MKFIVISIEHFIQQKILKDEEAKLANTVYVPERLIVNKEKSELYVKIDEYMKKNKKLSEKIFASNKNRKELLSIIIILRISFK